MDPGPGAGDLAAAAGTGHRVRALLPARARVPHRDDPVETIRRISSGPGLPAGSPFSLGSEENGTLYISGMPALDRDGNFVPGTFEEEADRAWANVIAIATAAGYSPDDLLYVQVLLGDLGNYTDINDWWRRQFPDPAKAPARLTFQAGALPFGGEDRAAGCSCPWPLTRVLGNLAHLAA